MIEYEDGMLDELIRNVFYEDEFVDISMMWEYYDLLIRGIVCCIVGKGRKEFVILQWFGFFVQLVDFY